MKAEALSPWSKKESSQAGAAKSNPKDRPCFRRVPRRRRGANCMDAQPGASARAWLAARSEWRMLPIASRPVGVAFHPDQSPPSPRRRVSAVQPEPQSGPRSIARMRRTRTRARAAAPATVGTSGSPESNTTRVQLASSASHSLCLRILQSKRPRHPGSSNVHVISASGASLSTSAPVMPTRIPFRQGRRASNTTVLAYGGGSDDRIGRSPSNSVRRPRPA